MGKPRRAKKPLHHLIDYFFPHRRNGWRPHFFSVASLAVLVVVIIGFEIGYISDLQYLLPSQSFLGAILPGALLDLTNEDRAANDAPAVVENSLLDQAAGDAAQDMATKGYFAHISPSGVTPWDWLDKVGYDYSYAGENLAVNFTDSDAVENAWMASPSHHANIVKPQYTQIGFGTATGQYQGQSTIFVVTFFGAPAAVAAKAPTPAPTPTPAPLPVATAPAAPSTPAVLAAAVPPAPAAPAGWLDRVLASPVSTATTAAAALLALVCLLFAIAVAVKPRVQHKSVWAGAALLVMLSAGALFIDQAFPGRVQLPTDTQDASAVSALAQ